jgi:hypothetical protein
LAARAGVEPAQLFCSQLPSQPAAGDFSAGNDWWFAESIGPNASELSEAEIAQMEKLGFDSDVGFRHD